MLVSEHLGELADSLVGHFVDQARRTGASWSQIGTSMGVSKQAAQQRFVPRVPGDASPADGPDTASSPFARFTPRTRNALVAAHNAARQANHDEVGPAHLLLGLLSEPEALAARVLVASGSTMAAVEEAARRALPPVVAEGAGSDIVPYSGASKAVLEQTLAVALRLGHNYVGTEHILLALAEVDEVDAEAGGSAGPLAGLGLTAAGLEQAVAAALAV